MSFFKNLSAELGTATGKGVTVFISACWKVFCLYASYLFKIEHKDGEHVMHTNSFRIANWSLLLAFLFIPGLVTCSFSPKDIVNSKILNPNKINILTNLSNRPPSFFPKNENFAIDYDQTTQHYRDFDNMRLFAYHQRQNEKYPTIVVQEKMCAVVPAGKKISFLSKTPPVYAANMVNEVYYFGKIEHLSFLKRNTIVFYYITGSLEHFQVVSDTWKEISDHWEKVDTTYHILAEARDKNDIRDGVAGGMVCF